MSGAIVFDLDGTLIDSAPDIHAAVNRLLSAHGHAPLPLPTVIGFIGNGIPTLVRRVMAARDIPPEAEPEMIAGMLAQYAAHPADLTQPYPGVLDALQALSVKGHALGICTNKAHAATLQVLDALDMTGFFDVVIGGDSLPVHKPDPAPLLAAFDALPGAALLYVGDSEVDAETAKRAELPFALFTRGYRKAAVGALPHLVAFDDFAALPAHVSRMRPAKPS